jgi:hypothetical protein
VFGCEKGCHPDEHKSAEYKLKDTEFPYLNSGLFIGPVKELRTCMSGYKYNDTDDDQRFWTKQFLENPHKIELDYENYIFLNTVDMDMERFTWNGNTAYYKWNNPMFVHVNGPDKSFLKQLGRTSKFP